MEDIRPNVGYYGLDFGQGDCLMAQTTGAARTDATVKPTIYEIDYRSAIIAGIAATLLFSACYSPMVPIYRQNSLDIPLLLGSFLTGNEWLARLLGIGIHMGIGVGIALSYAILLYIFRLQSNAGKGTVFGYMVFIPMMAFLMPWAVGWSARFGLPHGVLDSGAHLWPVDTMLNQVGNGNAGWDACALVLCAHLMYGLLLGALYRHKTLPLDGRYRIEYSGG
jgi:hypothetical protein